MKNRMHGVIGVAALVGCVGTAGVATAQVAPGWTITRVLTTETPLPGGEGTFAGFSPYSVMTDGRSVAFSASATGVYVWTTDGIDVVVDTSTSIPGFKGSFSEFGPPFFDETGVYFVASGVVDGVTRRGVYRSDETGLHVVADTRTPAPGGAGNYVDFIGSMGSGDSRSAYVAADAGVVMFAAREPDRAGMYLATPQGVISTVADSLTPLPGIPPQTSVRQYLWPSISGKNVAFGGFSPHGIFLRNADEFMRFAAPGSAAPGGGSFGSGLGSTSIHNGEVLFFAFAGTTRGIYRAGADGVELILNHESALPGEPGPVSGMDGFGFDRGRVAVVVTGINGHTVFAEVNGAMRRVIDAAGALEGHEVESFYVESTGFARCTVSVTAFFTDGTKALYLLRPTCPADWNLDAGVNSQDFFDFLGAFFAGDADFNEDDSTNSQDFFDFLSGFFTGC